MIHGRADRHGDSPPRNTGLSPASVGLLKTSNFQVGKLRWDEPYPRKQLLLPSSANTSSERCAVTCAEMCSSAWSSSSEINIEKCQWLCPWTYGQLVREKLLDLDWGDVRSRKPPEECSTCFYPQRFSYWRTSGVTLKSTEKFSLHAQKICLSEHSRVIRWPNQHERKPNQNKPPNMINSTTVLEIPISYNYFRRK